MSENQKKILEMRASKKMGDSDRANGKNGRHSSSWGLSWYFAQPAIPGLIYGLTINGYVASGVSKTKGGKQDV